MAFARVSSMLVSAALLVGLTSAIVDTSTWIGAEYTPAAAPANGLWWHWYENYTAAIERELGYMSKRMAVTTVRLFLAPLVWEVDGTALIQRMDSFLAAADAVGIRAGFVFFDDCFTESGASIDVPCEPVPGVHNGCWFTAPQFPDRDSIERYEGYVTSIVTAFANDTRVAWWEVFNEPDLSLNYTVELRAAGYAWATGVQPLQPVISCWDDSPYTQLIDHHDYTTDFQGWQAAVYSNPAKGGIITEGGSRWYQGAQDAGSPLLAINFLQALKAQQAAGNVSWVPGAMINWEVMVGNSNTRWHWGTAAGAAEPAVPFDGHLWPDGTPVSHTEAAALRAYVTGNNEFLSYSKFLPEGPPAVVNGDYYLSLPAGQVWQAPLSAGVTALTDAVVEASVWLTAGGSIDIIARAGAAPAVDATVPAPAIKAALPDNSGNLMQKPKKHIEAAASIGFSQSQLAVQASTGVAGCTAVDGNCTQGPVMNDTDVCPGGPPGYRDLSVATAPDPLAACAAACCAWSECTAWIVRQFSGTDANCTNTLCCWLKPGCSSTAPASGAQSAFLTQPPGPPVPTAGTQGYHLTITAAAAGSSNNTDTMTLSRVDTPGGAATLLGSFNLSSLPNGLVKGAWNIVRLAILSPAPPSTGPVSLQVYFNPYFGETGFVGNFSDAGRVPLPLPPRITVVDSAGPAGGLAPGGLLLAAGGYAAQVDYISALPTSVL